MSPSTICRVLAKNDFVFGALRSAHLADGHDRIDVQQYRDAVFIPELLKLWNDPRYVLVWFDESWINRDVSQVHGWYERSSSVVDKPTGKGQRVCMTAFVSVHSCVVVSSVFTTDFRCVGQ